MTDKPASNAPSVTNNRVLGGLWKQKGINPHLIAVIRPVIEGNLEAGQGNQTYDIDATQPQVHATLDDGSFDLESQYSTPFESSNPEGRMPNLMGAIQSGQIATSYHSLFAIRDDPIGISGAVGDVLAGVGELFGVQEALEGFESSLVGLMGRSNFTKINSRQIFTSSNSVRITATLNFLAWLDARTEVEDAIDQLQQWALPKTLSSKSLLTAGLTDGFSEGMFPSIIPPFVQLEYGGKTYLPMLIESVSAPITAPMNKKGDRIAVKVSINLLSLTAWDAENIRKLRG